MGLFSGIKNTYKKSEAAVIVQNLLEELKQNGLFDSDPAIVANKLVEAAWETRPDVFSGKYGERPHKLSLAAYSLANAIDKLDRDSRTRATLQIPFGQLMREIVRNAKSYPFNEVDHILLSGAAQLFDQLTAEMHEDPLSKEMPEMR